jgi:hypothetical protein
LSNSEKSDSGEMMEDSKPSALRPRTHHKLNPLTLQKIPPVPEERMVSREYGAGVFSKITFHWMAPLMRVSDIPGTIGHGMIIRKMLTTV